MHPIFVLIHSIKANSHDNTAIARSGGSQVIIDQKIKFYIANRKIN